MPFIAVHAGAGHFDENDIKELKKVCKHACDEGMRVLKEGGNASEAITVSISVLEDSLLTNAGRGSCLTYNGTVECDASIMYNKGGHFASISAVSGIQNPINLAHTLMIHQSKGLLSLERIPPMCLCGQGAYEWAKENNVPTCSPDDLITDKSKEIYLDHMDMLREEKERLEKEDKMKEEEKEPPNKRLKQKKDHLSNRLDTVGAICYDDEYIAAGVSSGGISLKHSGRIGQAGVYGCGCWADDQSASSVSGVGEYLIKTQLAKELAIALRSMTIQEAFIKTFTSNSLLINCEPKQAGAIALQVTSSGSIEFSWVHSTDSMLIAYNNGDSSKVMLSRLTSEGSTASSRIMAGWLSF